MPTNRKRSSDRTNFLQDEFRSYSRKPFLETLGRLMECEPEPARLQEFANQYPDRWAGAIKTIAGLAGYHDKLEITGNITIELAQMGDAQLLARLEEVNKKLLELDADQNGEQKTIDITPQESSIKDLVLIESTEQQDEG